MANLKHLKLLKRGVKQWNFWRLNNHISTDLNGADFGGMKLEGADLSRAGLTESNLQSANLSGVDFDHACLRGANLRGANCTGADFHQALLADADFTSADLTNADMTESDMSEINFSFANLNGLNLHSGFIWGATFRNNDLTKVGNLDILRHQGPSSIDLMQRPAIRSVYRRHPPAIPGAKAFPPANAHEVRFEEVCFRHRIRRDWSRVMPK